MPSALPGAGNAKPNSDPGRETLGSIKRAAPLIGEPASVGPPVAGRRNGDCPSLGDSGPSLVDFFFLSIYTCCSSMVFEMGAAADRVPSRCVTALAWDTPALTDKRSSTARLSAGYVSSRAYAYGWLRNAVLPGCSACLRRGSRGVSFCRRKRKVPIPLYLPTSDRKWALAIAAT